MLPAFCQILTKTLCIITRMNTAQNNTYKKNAKLPVNGFDAFRRRIAAQISLFGVELSEDEDDTLFDFYRQGENETYVLAALGYEN